MREESTPPLKAMHTFRIFEELSFLDILSSKEVSMKSRFTFSLTGWKSFHVFFGKLGLIDGSYLNVSIFTIDEGEMDTLELSTPQPPKN